MREADALTVYAVGARYPDFRIVTEEEFHQAICLAEKVVAWVEESIDK